ncbi:MAG: XF1762 family protein [Rhodospirillaceae bacterium]
MLELQPISRDEAFAFIKRHHRHHPAPQGWKFGVAVNDGAEVVGVLTVGRPVARGLDDGYTLEVTRCCVLDRARNACSKLYAAAWRAARALGYRRLVTYTLADETGASLVAAGWRVVHQTRGGSWSCPSRPRVDTAPTGQKTLWEAGSVPHLRADGGSADG